MTLVGSKDFGTDSETSLHDWAICSGEVVLVVVAVAVAVVVVVAVVLAFRFRDMGVKGSLSGRRLLDVEEEAEVEDADAEAS
jgi:hypothetical protein